MKKLLIVIIVIVIIVAFVALRGSDDQAETPTPSTSRAVLTTIALDDPLVSGSTYIVNTVESALHWSASRIVGTSHNGTVPILSGEVTIDEEGASTGSFVIDMSNIMESNDNEKFLGHVNSVDFFDTENFATSTFELTGIEAVEEPQNNETHTVTGDLTIIGKTNEITFPARVLGDDSRLMAQGNFEIDRTKWDITFDSGNFFTDLGDKAIKDEVSFDLTLVLDKDN